MSFFRYTKGIFQSIITSIFSGLGYKGVVNTQISLYKKIRASKEASEDEIICYLLSSRLEVSNNDIGAESYYQELLKMPNKNLEWAIVSILEWEYFGNQKALEKIHRNNIPQEYVNEYYQEMLEYVRIKVTSLK